MHVLYTNDKDAQKEIESLMKKAVESNHLIPVIGTGFTAGSTTRSGRIPDVNELGSQLIKLLLRTETYHEKTEADFDEIPLADIAGIFWMEMEKEENAKIKARFFTYIEENFMKTQDFSSMKRKFLNSGWRYIYTLNYDDAIETFLDISKIVPYDGQNESYLEQHHCLFKLHGDADRYIKTGDPRYFILSKRQYLDSLSAKENKDMLDHLLMDFGANYILFVGCGLNDELDLLFAAEVGLPKKVLLNNELPRIIYILYRDNGMSQLTTKEEIKLQNYGISHVIVADGEQGMNQLYQLINNLYQEYEKISKEDELERYKALHFKIRRDDDPKNINYFFINDCIKLENGTVALPSFFVERGLGKEILQNLDDQNMIHVISGQRISGKTYLLLQLAKSLPPETTYYLPIAINDRVLNSIKQKKNCTFIIDKGALTVQQIKELFSDLQLLKKNRSRIILAINSDDRDFLEFYAERAREGIVFYRLKNKLEGQEIADFNSHVAKLRLVDYHAHDTILDFLFKAEDTMFVSNHKRILPPVKFLCDSKRKELKAMIVLATENVISFKLASQLGIAETLIELSSTYDITIQKDYLTQLESEENYSHFKFVNNSPYWVLRCLSECASVSQNHAAIADAYCSIIEGFERIYQTDNQNFDQRIKEYYLLDTLQTFYSNSAAKGTLRLPNAIYERLHNQLSGKYQFLHQEAKCELRLARHTHGDRPILETLQKSFGNINRALDLAEKSKASKVEYSINHMKVTKALILSNYLLIGNQSDKVRETIQVYYEAFVEESSLLEDNFLRKDDLSDVNRFLNYVLSKFDHEKLTPESKEQFEEIYEMRFRKHVTLA